MNSQSKRLLVSGGASGIGDACVRLALERDWQVDVLDVAAPSVGDFAVNAAQVDLSDESARAAWIEGVKAAGTRYDYAVLCAGILHPEEASSWNETVWTKTLATNLIAPAHLLVGLADVWAHGAAIVLIGSIAAEDGSVISPAYAASKAGLIGLMKSATRILAANDLRINVLHPGPVDTPGRQRHREEFPGHLVAAAATLSAADPMPPRAVGAAAMALLENPNISRQSIRIEGQWVP